jgi:hypothetical protein
MVKVHRPSDCLLFMFRFVTFLLRINYCRPISFLLIPLKLALDGIPMYVICVCRVSYCLAYTVVRNHT